MYINLEEVKKLRNYCSQLRPYTYIERINYPNSNKDNSVEDYIGVGIYPTLYLSTCTIKEASLSSGLYYSDVYIIRNPSKEVCKAYLHDRNYKHPEPVISSSGVHTFWIVREIASIVLDYTDLQFEIKDPRLLNIYKSRKAFGSRILKVSADLNDFRYKVLKNAA